MSATKKIFLLQLIEFCQTFGLFVALLVSPEQCGKISRKMEVSFRFSRKTFKKSLNVCHKKNILQLIEFVKLLVFLSHC